jgi:hypothetical protein
LIVTFILFTGSAGKDSFFCQGIILIILINFSYNSDFETFFEK